MSHIKRSVFRLFDVSLRHTLQSSNGHIVPTRAKNNLLEKIICNFNPMSIEVGSLAYNKVYPHLSDSEKVFEHALDIITSDDKHTFTPYLFVPPIANKIDRAIEIGCDSISIPSSVSEEYQQKNVGISIDDTHRIIIDYARYLPLNNIKVYISCVNYCPVSKKTISPKTVAQEVVRYIFYQEVTQVCLSDVSGTLTDDDLIAIMTILKRLLVHPSKVGLHLHAGPTFIDQQRIAKLLGVAKLAGIKWIDVSLVGSQDQSIVINKQEPRSNLKYSDIYAGLAYSEKQYADLISSRRLLPFSQSV